MDCIVYDGKLIPKSEFTLSLSNRAFRYGDALFETILISNGVPANLPLHLERLARGMELLKMDLPNWLEGKEIHEALQELSQANKLPYGRARMTVYRSGEGLYSPEINDVTYVIEIEGIRPNDPSGLQVGIYRETKKPIHLLSNLKTSNALQYVLAGVYKKEKGYDDCLILNEKGSVAEAISSNVFFIKGNNLFTPATGEGCVLGVMRKKILMAAHSYFDAVTECEILPEDLIGFDEAYLSNAIQGIRWIKSIDDYVFNCKKLPLMEKLVKQ